MQKLDFSEAVERITESDLRYHEDAYYFLREALDHALKQRKRAQGHAGHVTGQEICESARQLAIKQYGPMAKMVLNYWGVQSTDDFGEIIWLLIQSEIFGKNDSDTKADFHGIYDFSEAFVLPYLPDVLDRITKPVPDSGTQKQDVPF